MRAWKGGTVGSSKKVQCVYGGGGVRAQASRVGGTLHTHPPLHEAAFKVEVPRSTPFSQPQLPVRAEPNVLPLQFPHA